jgi:hypothetical protein
MLAVVVKEVEADADAVAAAYDGVELGIGRSGCSVCTGYSG